MNCRILLVAFLFFILNSISLFGQTSIQNFGIGTATHTSATGSAAVIPNPTSGTTWVRGGAVVPNAPIVLATASNPLGTTDSYVRAVASSTGAVTKFSPWVAYTGGTEFYTSFKVLFGDASAGTTATSGVWKFYQGAGAMYSDVNDFTGAQVFTGLTFTYGVGGALALTYRGGAANLTTGLTQTVFASGTVYTIEIVGNNKTAGTINYTYSGVAQTVAVQKFDLYVNGILIGNDLAEAALPSNTSINAGTFIGISSASNAANIFVDDVTTYNAVPAAIVGTITSAQTGNWSDTTTWVGGVVPTSGVNAIIASPHVVTMNTTTGGINVRNSGTTTTINSGATLATAVTYTNSGTTTVNGTFQINEGGYANGNALTYAATGSTLIMNNSSGPYGISTGQSFWPTTNPPFNVTIQGIGFGSEIVNTVGAVAGTLTLANQLKNTAGLTVNGTLQINAGGYVNTNAPIYGNASLLRYNINGYFGRGFEWTTTGTIGVTPGYPNDVQVTNNTTLDYPNTGAGAFSTNLGLNRDLTIDLGSSLFMDYGGFNKSGSLTVGRNITISGSLSLGNAVNGDLFVGGNWTRTGTFSPNSRTVNFTGATAQTLTGITAFDFLTMNGAGGLTLNNAITVNQNLVFTSGKITLGTSDLTLVGTVTGAGTTNYAVTNSTGQFKKIVGGTAILFPVGNSAYNPITFTNSGTSDTYGVRVLDGAITTGTANTKTVQRRWVTTETVAGNSNLAVVAQYNTGEPDTGFAAATTPYIGFYNGTTWSQVGANLSGSFLATSTANSLPADLTTGIQYFAIGKDNAFVSVATKFVITAISPTSPTAGIGFSVTVRSQDVYNDFSNVAANTVFILTTNGQAGAISGTITGTIFAGTNTVTITGVILAAASLPNATTLTATRTSGDTLTAGISSLFTVLPPASQLAFVGVPASGFVGVPIASFTVEARRPDNSVDNTFTNNITIAIATGSGILSGTLTVAAVAGVATFSTAQFDTATVYTIITSSGSLTTNTSGNITITNNTDFYRSKTSGNWNAATTWESSVDGTTGWADATLTPNAFNTVYIQSSHTVTLTQNQSCKDLNIASGTAILLSTNNNLGKIDLGSFTLNVNGKMRDYWGTVGTVPGTNQINGYSVYPFIGTTGKVSIVGTTRTLLNSGEWGATITNPSSGVFPIEFNMFDNTQVATFTTNLKCSNFNLVTGTVSGIIISTDTGTTAVGNITIGTGTTLISSADSTFPLPNINVFQRTGSTRAGTLTIAGTLKLTGALPRFSMNAVVNTGAVEYGGADQTFMNVANGGVAMTYNNVIISGTGTKSLLTTPTVMTGDLNVNASNFIIKVDEVIEVKKAVTVAASGATFEIRNNGQLIQVDDIVNAPSVYSGGNSGDIIYNRTATGISGYDYVYWASPVTGQDISSIYTITTPGFKYKWNPLATTNINYTLANGVTGNWESASGLMIPSTGYIVRGSTSFGMAATSIPATFKGVPNNGIVSASISRGNNQVNIPIGPGNGVAITSLDDNWNLIGNPYPSAIDAVSFLADSNNNSNIDGFVWLWRHLSAPTPSANPFYGSFAANYNTNSYISYNSMGSNPLGFNGKIAAGQSFFVRMVDGTTSTQTVLFKNTMRKENITNAINNNAQFYRNSSPSDTDLTVEKHRIWLDLVNINNNSVSTLVGYAPDATVGIDRMSDANIDVTDENSIYTIVDNTILTIQGRPTPFDSNDQVVIGINALIQGDYKIAIAAVDGLFLDGQDIFLEDRELNIIHDLRAAPYSFTTAAGRTDNRFILRYTSNALGNPDFGTLDNSVVVATNNGELTIKSSIENMQEVTVYDILGRQLFEAKNINNTNYVASNISLNQQALIVKITLENGTVVTRKIVL